MQISSGGSSFLDSREAGIAKMEFIGRGVSQEFFVILVETYFEFITRARDGVLCMCHICLIYSASL